MRVTLNGELRELDPGTTVAAVVDRLARGRSGLAVAVNEEVVPRSRWERTTLSERDQVEILHAAQGG